MQKSMRLVRPKEIANDKMYNLGFDYPNLHVPIDYYLEDGEIIKDFEIKVLKTPGHSLDSTSYKLGNVLFLGIPYLICP